MTFAEVPIINLADFENGDDATKNRIAKNVDTICQTTGFFTVADHQVFDLTTTNIWLAVQQFFDLPLEEKLKYKVPYAGYPYGYMGLESESLAASRGDRSPPDIKETFNGGPLYTPAHITDPDALFFCYATTPWPTQPSNFVAAWTAYYEAMELLAQRIMRLFAAALQLDQYFFDSYISSPISALRALNYQQQPTPPQPGQLRAGAHSDYGTLTILWPQDDSRGLEIQCIDNTWQEVRPVPGALIINIGDLMARWTNDRWRSTLHRVVNPPDQHDPTSRRQSLAYFHQPDWFAEISCLDSCVDPSTGAKYQPVLSGPYLMSKFKSTI